MGAWDNFTLGLGGLVDLASHADDKLLDLFGVEKNSALRAGVEWNNTSLAATIYTSQSQVAGADDDQRAEALARAKQLEDNGLIEQAAANTFDQVAAGTGATLKTLLIVGAVAGGAVLAFKLARLVKA